ncbi:hypothetical protein N825_18465 [Skermanella stibiiresistens SB22]|uniref:Uncharacterized protein n=1 Tax=Skermanella stibiiresistens SB22 TaxID=1385369 RepID=W9HDF9_9PROT|nr:hypothetical protein [Skermanella stibiiresistens]EWY41938.1 hypothetical protein N825_18465 [Skermanella stibiiresistens SB22]
MRRGLRLVAAFLAAVLVTAAAGSIVQTQINLAALARFDVPLTASLRAATTLQDLVTFGPVMAAIAAAALLPALLVAHAVAKALPPRWRTPILGAAGVAGLWTAFSVMGYFTPMPTLVAAVRGPSGLALVCVTGAFGGFVHARLSRSGVRP